LPEFGSDRATFCQIQLPLQCSSCLGKKLAVQIARHPRVLANDTCQLPDVVICQDAKELSRDSSKGCRNRRDHNGSGSNLLSTLPSCSLPDDNNGCGGRGRYSRYDWGSLLGQHL